MTEDPQEYNAELNEAADSLAEQGYVSEAVEMLGTGYDSQDAAIIQPPRNIRALTDHGVVERRVWGWVKISANFIHHIKLLRGAKLAVWQVIALSIDENGNCDLTLGELVDLTDYSRSEISESIKELDAMGYLAVKREKGKSSMFEPFFAARGENNPTNEPVQKNDGLTRPVSTHNHPSSPAIKKSRSTIKELKRDSIYPDFGNMSPKEAIKIPTIKMYRMATNHFPGSPTWAFIHKTILENKLTAESIQVAFEAWMLKGFNPNNIAGIMEWAVNGVPNFKPQTYTKGKANERDKRNVTKTEHTESDRKLAEQIKAERAADAV